MSQAPVILYILLFLVTVFAPLRLSIIAFLLLANIDLGSTSASIGMLNTAKAMILPLWMLWRFRAYSGHGRIAAAPIAWCLLILYVAVASSWSLYPSYALKLIGHLIGSFLICMMLMRATKGGFLNFRTIVPVSAGVIAMAIFHWMFLHDWGGETERFTTFSGAQAFAAFLAALYCGALCARNVRPLIRIPLAVALAFSVLLNGSRIWIAGMLCSSLLFIFVSRVRPWAKVVTFGICLVSVCLLAGDFDEIMETISVSARSNRVAAALAAAYQGNLKSSGLGTYNFRHELLRRSLDAAEQGNIDEIIFGHGTCNGAAIAATLNRNPDPNRAMHNEWLRAFYEWGLVGLALWLAFVIALAVYAARGMTSESGAYAQPLLIYLPAFAIGLSGENRIAGAGNAVSVGLLVLVALAAVAHRPLRQLNRHRSSKRPWSESGALAALNRTNPRFAPPAL